MNNILQRIKKIIDIEGLTFYSFEKSIGASKGVLSRAYEKGTDIQTKWLISICENYPQYSPVWLLTGKGSLKNTPEFDLDKLMLAEKKFQNIISSYKEEILQLQKDLLKRQAEVIDLERQLKNSKSKKESQSRTGLGAPIHQPIKLAGKK